jgi:hypothetical protein
MQHFKTRIFPGGLGQVRRRCFSYRPTWMLAGGIQSPELIKVAIIICEQKIISAASRTCSFRRASSTTCLVFRVTYARTGRQNMTFYHKSGRLNRPGWCRTKNREGSARQTGQHRTDRKAQDRDHVIGQKGPHKTDLGSLGRHQGIGQTG